MPEAIVFAVTAGLEAPLPPSRAGRERLRQRAAGNARYLYTAVINS